MPEPAPAWPGSDPEIVSAVGRLSLEAAAHGGLTFPHLIEIDALLRKAGWASGFRIVVRGSTFSGGRVSVVIGPPQGERNPPDVNKNPPAKLRGFTMPGPISESHPGPCDGPPPTPEWALPVPTDRDFPDPDEDDREFRRRYWELLPSQLDLALERIWADREARGEGDGRE